ncbi:hypothetical protein HC341_07340 [Aquisalimonas sp. 2447]|uniref:hypothetical protein n=1 Tax=Aquisalimonas sp. 2447 TaxID=2740807 RepID=UPI001432719C|nr:hypothetical protein [Aquisalimonas sp. 2447]QIT55046.1 hypothetical protein HC341_07340 [Aquisalimonas sp. 2447]
MIEPLEICMAHTVSAGRLSVYSRAFRRFLSGALGFFHSAETTIGVESSGWIQEKVTRDICVLLQRIAAPHYPQQGRVGKSPWTAWSDSEVEGEAVMGPARGGDGEQEAGQGCRPAKQSLQMGRSGQLIPANAV